MSCDVHMNLLGLSPRLHYRDLTGMAMAGLFVMGCAGSGLTVRLDVMLLGVDPRGAFLPLGCFTQADAQYLVQAGARKLVVPYEDVAMVVGVFAQSGLRMVVVGARCMDDALDHVLVAFEGPHKPQCYRAPVVKGRQVALVMPRLSA